MGDIKNLVLCNADNRALSLFGIIMYLYNNNKYNSINNIICVDSGSILGLLMVLNIDILEIMKILIEFEPFSYSNGELSLFINHGIFNETYIKSYLTSVIKNKYTYIPTLEQLYKINNIKITFITYNISKQNIEYINHEKYPRMLIIDACIMSYIRPLIYAKYTYNNELYTGGILVNPYPINILDNNEITLILSAKNEHNNGKELTDYIDILLDSQIEEVKKRNLELATNDNIYDIEIVSTFIEYINDNNTTTNIKYKLIYNGYKSAQKYIPGINIIN